MRSARSAIGRNTGATAGSASLADLPPTEDHSTEAQTNASFLELFAFVLAPEPEKEMVRGEI